MSKPLDGLKVLDLSTFVAGPCTARLLADLGADVIKIEKDTGDDWRYTSISYKRDRFSHEENPVFDMYNTGKRFMTLNMKTPEGMEVFSKLLDSSDIFVTDMRKTVLEHLGIDYDSVKEKYPKLIYAMITGYGDKGPEKDTPAFDKAAFWARSGMLCDMAIPTENGDYSPMFPPSSVGDTVSAYLLISEITAALYQRNKTGKGQLVKSSLFHNGLFSFGPMMIMCQKGAGRVLPTERYNHPLPGGSYECKDGEWIFIATGMVHTLIHGLCAAIEKPELEFDERFNTIEKRKANAKEYYAILREAFLQKTSTEWLEILRKLDLAAVKMNHFADVSEDEQAWANGFIEKVSYKNGREDIVPSSPFHMSGSEKPPKTSSCALPGSDNEEILKSLGYTDEEIVLFAEKGITSVNLLKE